MWPSFTANLPVQVNLGAFVGFARPAGHPAGQAEPDLPGGSGKGPKKFKNESSQNEVLYIGKCSHTPGEHF